ncbi:SGNH hydrolase-type esterase domain-containing protein [Tricladium varicosporioides]|nr:SGNH hydrolase-type esterase domain-containing protein [Hymenoscyphus varicosporioides]
MIIANSLHVLCFGDSITHGFSKMGTVYHPYAIALQASLESAFPSWNITIDEQGQNGDQVASPPGGFLPRMDILYEEVHPHNPYDFAVVLGGTNDVCVGRPAFDIYEALKLVWEIPLSHETTVLALTIPEITPEPRPVGRIDKLNSAIMNHEDLHNIVPWKTATPAQRKEIWDDGIHFTPKGYDLIGNVIAGKIIDLVSKRNSLATQDPIRDKTSDDGKLELKRNRAMNPSIIDSRREGKRLRSGRMMGA